MGALQVIVVIGVIVCLLFFSPQIMAEINILLANFGFGTGGNADGQTAIAFSIYWTDGTHTDINKNSTLSLLPFSIYYQGKIVQRIEIYVNAKLTNGSSGTWSSNTALGWQVTHRLQHGDEDTTTPRASDSQNITDGGGSWTNGVVLTIAHITLTGSQLDAALAQWVGPNLWHLQCTATVDLTATINGQQISCTSTPVSGGIDFESTTSTTLSIEKITVSACASLKP